jgi:autotransporter-associated beta strand protein
MYDTRRCCTALYRLGTVENDRFARRSTTTTAQITGAGTMQVNALTGTIQIGGDTGGSFANAATLDMSGLATFTANLTNGGNGGTLRIGDVQAAGTNIPANSSVLLAVNSTITAGTLDIGASIDHNGTYTLKLGSGVNILNATSIFVGSGNTLGGGRASGEISFLGATGTLTIRSSTDTVFGRADLNVANVINPTGVPVTGLFDVRGHSSDLLLNNLNIGNKVLGANSTTAGASTGDFYFNMGTLDVSAVSVGNRNNLNDTSNAAGSLNIGGGAATFGGISMASAATTGTAGTGTAAALLNFTGGLITLGGAISQGTAGPTGSGTLTLAGASLDMRGNSIGNAIPISTLNFNTGTLMNVGEIDSGAAGLTKAAIGTLTLAGTNNYTGPTTVSAGTLLVNGTTSPSSAVTVAAGATLGGSGTVNGQVASLGTVMPSASGTPGTLTLGGLDLDPNALSSPGTLSIDLVGGGVSDLVAVTNTAVNLSGATLNLTASGTFLDQQQFTILTVPSNSGNLTGFFSNGSTITVGAVTFDISYTGGDGNDIVLTADTTNSPTLSSIVLNQGIAYINSTIASKQHSMVENVVYSFSSAISLSTSNFALTGIGGTTAAPNVALASSNGGTVWTVTFTGAGVNNATQSIGDGEYDLALTGVAGLAASTFDFFRLLGDMDGNGTVDSSDFNILISSFLRGTADPAYLGADDLDGNNKVDGSDFNIFVSNFLKKLPDTTLLH